MTDKELILKKTARRRLVGAITLVVLMLLVLPFVLKDRVADLAQEPVKVTVINEEAPALADDLPINSAAETTDIAEGAPTTDTATALAATEKNTAAPSNTEPHAVDTTTRSAESTAAAGSSEATPNPTTTAAQTPTHTAKPVDTNRIKNTDDAVKSAPNPATQAANGANQTARAQASANTSTDLSTTETRTPSAPTTSTSVREQASMANQQADTSKPSTTASAKTESNANSVKPTPRNAEKKLAALEKKDAPKKSAYFVQFGVFSDPKNLESLRQKLTQNGIASVVEPVGQNKFKLRSQPYAQRADAQTAQQQMQTLGVTGIVVGK